MSNQNTSGSDYRYQQIGNERGQGQTESIVSGDTYLTLIYNALWVGLYYEFLYRDQTFDLKECVALRRWSSAVITYCGLIFLFTLAYLILAKISEAKGQNDNEGSGKFQKLGQLLTGFNVSFRFIQMVLEVVLLTIIGIALSNNEPCGNLRVLNIIFFCISFTIIVLIVGFFCVVGQQKGAQEVMNLFLNKGGQGNQENRENSNKNLRQNQSIINETSKEYEEDEERKDNNDETQPLNPQNQ